MCRGRFWSDLLDRRDVHAFQGANPALRRSVAERPGVYGQIAAVVCEGSVHPCPQQHLSPEFLVWHRRELRPGISEYFQACRRKNLVPELGLAGKKAGQDPTQANQTGSGGGIIRKNWRKCSG